MNWSAFAAIVSLLGLLATPLTAAYFYGKIAQKVDGHDREILSLTGRVNGHDSSLGQIQGWRESFAGRHR